MLNANNRNVEPIPDINTDSKPTKKKVSKTVKMAVLKVTEDKRKEMIAHSQNGNVVTETTCINESGLYSLILSSKLPQAKAFKRWVTSDVLPSVGSSVPPVGVLCVYMDKCKGMRVKPLKIDFRGILYKGYIINAQ